MTKLEWHLFDQVAYVESIVCKNTPCKVTLKNLKLIALRSKQKGMTREAATDSLYRYATRNEKNKPRKYFEEWINSAIRYSYDTNAKLHDNEPISFSKKELDFIMSLPIERWQEELFWFYSIVKHRAKNEKIKSNKYNSTKLKKLSTLRKNQFKMLMDFLEVIEVVVKDKRNYVFKDIELEVEEPELTFKCHEYLVAHLLKYRGYQTGWYRCSRCGDIFLGSKEVCPICNKLPTHLRK